MNKMKDYLSWWWKIKLNGKEIDKSRKDSVKSIDIKERFDGSDEMTLDIYDADLIFIQDDIFIKDVPISVEIGLHNSSEKMSFDGYISAIDIVFPEDGCPIMTIFCLDKSHLMNRKKKKRSWDKVSRADVASKIAKEYGFKFVKDKSYKGKKEDNIAQSNETDLEFLEKLANDEKEKYICKLINDTIHYMKLGLLSEPRGHLFYRSYPFDIISFNPKINRETKNEEVEKADINTDSKKVDSALSNDNNTQKDTQGNPVETSSSPIKNTKGLRFNPKSGERGWK